MCLLITLGEENKDWCFGDYAFGIAVGVGAVAATPFVLSAAGFTAGGVAASSLAAGVQSAVYGGAVGSTSIFAALQSAGAAGMGVVAKVIIGSAAGGAATYVKSNVSPCNVAGKPRCPSEEN